MDETDCSAAAITVEVRIHAQADELLRGQVDAMMQFFRVTNAEFYNDYKAARVIKDLGGRHTKAGQPAAPAGAPN